ncbi:MAG: fumarate hydratase [Clostridia bacterium]|nr:fumarate hydratase [Clostridia bacterium]
MKIIDPSVVTSTVKQLYLDLNYNIDTDIKEKLELASKISTNDTEKYVIECIIKNSEIASTDKIALCQDTGMAVLFVEYGDEVVCPSFSDAVNEGVRQAYADGYLRKSIVDDPLFDRKNTQDNTPAIIHTQIVKGDKIKITAGAKGFGSENMSCIKMFNPTASTEEICNYIIDCVKTAGANPCPPIIVGIGMGGTFEQAALLSKKATFRLISIRNPDIRYAQLEQKLYDEINALNIGCGGFGGNTTTLGVNIEYYPTHIAGLPVAVNISCHSTRHRSCTI